MYAYKELKSQLEQIDEFRFIFTSPTIVQEQAEKQRREFYNVTGENMGGFMTVDSPVEQTAYMPLNGFTTVDIGCERGNNSYNMVNRMEAPFSTQYMQLFETLWNDHEKMQYQHGL